MASGRRINQSNLRLVWLPCYMYRSELVKPNDVQVRTFLNLLPIWFRCLVLAKLSIVIHLSIYFVYIRIYLKKKKYVTWWTTPLHGNLPSFSIFEASRTIQFNFNIPLLSDSLTIESFYREKGFDLFLDDKLII